MTYQNKPFLYDSDMLKTALYDSLRYEICIDVIDIIYSYFKQPKGHQLMNLLSEKETYAVINVYAKVEADEFIGKCKILHSYPWCCAFTLTNKCNGKTYDLYLASLCKSCFAYNYEDCLDECVDECVDVTCGFIVDNENELQAFCNNYSYMSDVVDDKRYYIFLNYRSRFHEVTNNIAATYNNLKTADIQIYWIDL